MAVDWEEPGTLGYAKDGEPDRPFFAGPLRALLIMAVQGHMGSLDALVIKMQSGARFRGYDIRTLAMHPERPRL